jgi:hypothetical protein
MQVRAEFRGVYIYVDDFHRIARSKWPDVILSTFR